MPGTIHIFIGAITPAPPEAVWAALSAAPRWPQVLDDLIAAHIEPDGVIAPGAVMQVRARPGTAARDMSYRVLEVERPRHLVIESASTDFRARTSYAITEVAGGTRVNVTSIVEPVWWLHKITTALSRRHYTRELTAAGQTRLRAMLTLAENIHAERTG